MRTRKRVEVICDNCGDHVDHAGLLQPCYACGVNMLGPCCADPRGQARANYCDACLDDLAEIAAEFALAEAGQEVGAA